MSDLGWKTSVALTGASPRVNPQGGGILQSGGGKESIDQSAHLGWFQSSLGITTSSCPGDLSPPPLCSTVATILRAGACLSAGPELGSVALMVLGPTPPIATRGEPRPLILFFFSNSLLTPFSFLKWGP